MCQGQWWHDALATSQHDSCPLAIAILRTANPDDESGNAPRQAPALRFVPLLLAATQGHFDNFAPKVASVQ